MTLGDVETSRSTRTTSPGALVAMLRTQDVSASSVGIAFYVGCIGPYQPDRVLLAMRQNNPRIGLKTYVMFRCFYWIECRLEDARRFGDIALDAHDVARGVGGDANFAGCLG